MEHSSDATITKKAGSFAYATFLSRILGYVRDSLVAAYFGGGLQTDAFYAATKIPNLLRRFLGEGALTAAFVPVFTETLHRKGKAEATHLLNSLFSGLLVLLSIIVILGMIFAGPITKVVSYGFLQDLEKFNLTVQLTRLTFPFLLIISIAALMTAVLNSTGRFFIPALAPSGLSIAEIIFILLIASQLKSPIKGLAISAVIGVCLHVVWQLPSFYKEGFRFRFANPWAHPQVRTIVLLMIPTIIGLCADQVNSFVDQVCASFLQDGAITAIYNSNRIMQLPLALFGVAISSVALPALARTSGQDEHGEFKKILGLSIRLANYVLVPSLIGLIVLGLPIIQVLFEHGRFTHEQTLLTYRSLMPYALGLPAFSTSKILASAFYSKKDTKTPVVIAFWAMFLNCILDVLLMPTYDVAGLAMATAISAWFQTIYLFWAFRKRTGFLGGRLMARSFAKSLAIGLAMAFVCWFCYQTLYGGLPLLVRTFLAIGSGAITYFGLSKLFKFPELDGFLEMIMRRPRSN